MKNAFIVIGAALCIAVAAPAGAVDIYVSPGGAGVGTMGDPIGLQGGLDLALDNGSADTLFLQTGTYSTGGSAFLYDDTADGMNVFIRGGWNAAFDTQTDDPSLTVLDGGGADQIFLITNANDFSFEIELQNVTFANGNSGGDPGGGVSCDPGGGDLLLTITDSVFSHNTADTGGGLYSACVFDVLRTAFTGNSANSGGAIYTISNTGPLGIDPAIVNCSFDNNHNISLGGNGSTIRNANTQLALEFSTLRGLDGGGSVGGSPVYSDPGSELFVVNSTFRGFSSENNGGAIYLLQASAIIANSLFADNVAGLTSGSAAVHYTDGGSGTPDTVTIVNSTFVGNSDSGSDGPGLFNTAGNMTVANSIFWNNGGSGGIFSQGGSAVISNSDVQGGVAGSNFTDSGGNIDLDPLFVSPTDLHLKPASPCIDSGDNAAAAAIENQDIDGDPRILDGDGSGTATVDMGFDEFFPLPKPTILANGQEGSLTIPKGTPLEVVVSLSAGSFKGVRADYWVVAVTSLPAPFNVLYYDLTWQAFVPGLAPTAQGPIVDVKPRTVLSRKNLPPGSYTFFKGVDTVVNGTVDKADLYSDKVKVTVLP